MSPSTVRLGDRHYDLTDRALVMGVLNRTPDSFFDHGTYWDLDAFFRRAERLVADGADVLDVGGVKAGPGPEVSEAEELDRVVGAIDELHRRFDIPLSVDTWRAAVARAAYRAGAVMGNDISGFGDPDYLAAAAEAGATVVATHIRLAPRVADPDPRYGDVVAEVGEFLRERAQRAEAAGIASDRIVLDAGLDLGKTAAQSLILLRASDRVVATGYPVLLSASNKAFLGKVLGLEVDRRATASLAAAAIGLTLGCRIIRAHDVLGTRQVCDVLGAIWRQPAARAGTGAATAARAGTAAATAARAGTGAATAAQAGTAAATAAPAGTAAATAAPAGTAVTAVTAGAQ